MADETSQALQTIRCGALSAVIAAKGAELKSFKSGETEWMWEGDLAFWAKTSPVLFPYVGALRGGRIRIGAQTYPGDRHGFARDCIFTVRTLKDSEIDILLENAGYKQSSETPLHSPSATVFSLTATEDTRRRYPFDFTLRLIYILTAKMLILRYEVENKDDKLLYFSLGAHPAFRLHGPTEDYELAFEQEETADFRRTKEGLYVEEKTYSALRNSRVLPLSEELLAEDAIIFRDLRSAAVCLQAHRGGAAMDIGFKGFPFLGIWKPPKAPFVCIEPWCGHADPYGFEGTLAEKPGIIRLPSGEVFQRDLTLTPRL